MSIWALLMVDKPSPNTVFPLIIGTLYSAMKMGTQMAFNTTPQRFFIGRTFISMYNLALLVAIWYKLREGRREKQQLEYAFFRRTESIMQTMNSVLKKDLPMVSK